jgi:hypothetical protein
MQDCFRLHPEIYGDELADDEEEAPADGVAEAGAADGKSMPGETDTASPPSSTTTSDAKLDTKPAASHEPLPAGVSDNKSALTSETK